MPKRHFPSQRKNHKPITKAMTDKSESSNVVKGNRTLVLHGPMPIDTKGKGKAPEPQPEDLPTRYEAWLDDNQKYCEEYVRANVDNGVSNCGETERGCVNRMDPPEMKFLKDNGYPQHWLVRRLAKTKPAVDNSGKRLIAAQDAADELYSYFLSLRSMNQNFESLPQEDTTEILVRYDGLKRLLATSQRLRDPENVVQQMVHMVVTAKAYIDSLRTNQRSLTATFESWEDMVEEDGVIKTPAAVTEDLMEKVSVAMPFLTLRPSYEVKESHPVLHYSRVASAALLYLKAAAAVRAHLEQKPQHKAVVFDVGAAVFGSDKLQMLLADGRNLTAGNRDLGGGFYIHATLPVVDAADNDRMDKFRMGPKFSTYNYLPETRKPVANRLNYCYHKASDCDCMKYYDHVEAVTVHAAYYFSPMDYDQVFKYTQRLTAIVHVPEVGTTIPKNGSPEYEWTDECESSDFRTKWLARYRRFVTGVGQVRMHPLQTAETGYAHPDVGATIRNGGYHFTSFTPYASRVAEPGWDAIRCVGTAAAAAAATAFVATPGPLPVKVLQAGNTFVSSVVGQVLFAKVAHKRASQREPPMETVYTVEAKVVKSYVETKTDEEVCQQVTFTKRQPVALDYQATSSVRVDTEQLSRATTGVLLGGTGDKNRRGVMASLVRDKVSIEKVKGTMSQAIRIVSFLDRVEQPPPAPSLPRWLLAVCSLPFALAGSTWSASALIAQFSPQVVKYGVTVFGLQVPTKTLWCMALAVIFPQYMFLVSLLLATGWVLLHMA